MVLKRIELTQNQQADMRAKNKNPVEEKAILFVGCSPITETVEVKAPSHQMPISPNYLDGSRRYATTHLECTACHPHLCV
jgi:hypothetical protein